MNTSFNGQDPRMLVRMILDNPDTFRPRFSNCNGNSSDITILSTPKKIKLDEYVFRCINDIDRYQVVTWRFFISNPSIGYLENYLIIPKNSTISWLISYKISGQNSNNEVLLDADLLVINSTDMKVLTNLQEKG